MKIKSLLLATAIAGIATTAQAQVLIPAAGPNDGDAALHGTGASSIQNVLVQEFNCVGVNNQLGTSSASPNGAFTTIAAGNFVQTNPTTSNPNFNCATQDVQPNFSAKYVATGSGFGRAAWSRFGIAQFDPTTANVFNPFNKISGQPVWTRVQFAFADSNVTPGDLTAYGTNANNATNKTGPAIVFPKYVLPVAIAYNPVYGKNAGGTDMSFNVKKPGVINGVTTGGLPLSRVAYCKVFNGEITNFNDAVFKTANSNTTLQDTVNDTATRWASDGVPIRLVGRMDRSGTTDLFTRHLAAVCTGVATTNKFFRNAETLPYNSASGVSFSNVRGDTGLATGNNNGGNYPNAGNPSAPVNSVSGDFFNGTAIVYNGSGPSSKPAVATPNQGTGLFIVGDGSSRVRGAINLAPDYALNGVTLNGRIGYIAADFVVPASGATLVAAALQVNGTGTSYAMPSAANAVAAFGTGTASILPPQSGSTGAFLTTDTRQVLRPDNTTGNAERINPLAWTAVLYAEPSKSLAAPVKGYPITGTAQYMGYTCYAETGDRYQIVNFLSLNFGKVTKTSTNAAFSGNTFKGTGATALGTLAQSNIGVVPAAWQTAITETFLKKSTQTSNGVSLGTLGGNGLYIQNKYTLTANDANPAVSAADAQSNPVCVAGLGA